MMYILDDPIVRCWGNIWGNRQQGSGMPSLPRLSAPHRRALDLTDERSGRARPAPPAGDRSRSLSAGTAARSACAVAGTVIAAETGHGAIRKTPPPGWSQECLDNDLIGSRLPPTGYSSGARRRSPSMAGGKNSAAGIIQTLSLAMTEKNWRSSWRGLS